ncbi:MAG: hypothetical protein B6I38_01380 [Anaerolineaceae bacterium 4572_5.1]|nr:MAG: hypothetical protein B5M51_10075 [Anaerolinea sp. 4484_236]OQY35595.1 MAG: hypothetical protein B6I38_01380 [Anaerolineaceae bacterium 4572_5.1]RLD05270.1 MAG: hypothetical protein DRI56_09975 [Chloroflexota bacterium]
MDILHLVDRLEELFNHSRSIPFTHSVIVDEDRMLDIIDQMRVAIPDEVRKAQQILSKQDRLIAHAQEKAARIQLLAQEESEKLVNRDSIVQQARKKAQQIEAEAMVQGEAARKDADDYVALTLGNLEIALERVITQVRNGIHILAEQQPYKQEAKPKKE